MKKIYSLIISCVLLCCAASAWGDEVTFPGTSTSYNSPIKTTYTDTQGTKSQFVYLKNNANIATMAGQNITGITFYANSTITWGSGSKANTIPTFEVKMAEVSEDAVNTGFLSPDFTSVYTGQPAKGSTSLVFEFTTPFPYSGSNNLLVQVEVITAGGYQSFAFYGAYQAGGTRYKYTSESFEAFVPKATFTYESAGGSSCVKPTSLSYSNLSSSSVDLDWTAGGSETAWNVLYKAGSADWVTIENITDNPYTLSLNPATSYQVQVKANCGGGDISSASNTVSFDSPCGATSLPFEDDFASASPCWTLTDCESGTGVSGGSFVFNYNTNPPQYLITPELVVSTNELGIEFKYKIANSYNIETFAVGYSTTTKDVAAFTFGESITATNTAYATYTETLPANVKYVAIKYESYDKYHLYIDDFKLTEILNCATPSGLSCSTTDAESATLSWAAGDSETAWVVEYSTTSDFSSNVHEANATTRTNFVLSELASSTKYYVHVKAVCGVGDESNYSDAIDFTTACAAITTPASWTEGFEDYAVGNKNSAAPGCWNILGANTGSDPKPFIYVTSSYNYVKTGSKGLYIDAFGDEGYAYAIFPEFTGLSALQVKFFYKMVEGTNSTLHIGYMTNIADGSSFVSLQSCTYKTDWEEKTADLSTLPSGARLAFRFLGDPNGYSKRTVGIDDISFEAMPTCVKPELGVATSITPEGATFSWTAGGTETQYQYCVVAKNAAASGWTLLDPNVSKFTITGKNANTDYDFYVRSYCSASEQSEGVKKSFKTAAVVAPTGVSVSSITTTTATAYWTAAANITTYKWCVVAKDAAVNWDAPISGTVTGTSASISGLTAGTGYDFYVKSYYAGNGAEAAAEKVPFTTQCDAITVDATHPFTENFDGISSGIPSCWDNSEGTTTNASYKWGYYVTGQSGHCVRFESKNNGSGKTNILASPTFELNTDADVVFWVKNKKGGNYTVEVSIDGGAPTSLSGIGNMTNISDWTRQEATLTAYQGSKIQFFFCGTSNWSESNDGYLYLDEFQILPQACRKPASDPEVSSKDESHATITWTAGGTNTDYQFCLAPAGTAEGDLVWDAANVVSALTKTISDLEPTTSYDFYVRTYCDADHQSDARKVSFRTSCGVYDSPFDENFDGQTAHGNDGIAPECWDNSASTMTTASFKWQVVDYSGRFGSKCLRCGSMADEEKTNILVSPEINVCADAYLTFWCKKEVADNLVIKVTKDNGSSFTQVLDASADVLTNWTLKYADLSAFAGEKVQIYFMNTASSFEGSYIYIDDIRVARGVVFGDATASTHESRLASLQDETTDFIMGRAMQFNGYYNTICLPFNLSAAEMARQDNPFYNCTLKRFDYSDIDNGELIVSIANAGSITAGVPYFISYDGATEANRTWHLFKEITLTASTPLVGSEENGQINNGLLYQGLFNSVNLVDLANAASKPNDQYIYLGAENTLYWPETAGYVGGFRAYLYLDKANPMHAPRGIRVRLVERPKTPTAIDNTDVETVSTIKRLENGQVVIIRNGMKYTIQGQRIQ